MFRNRSGFTLVEALITLGIIGVIAGLAIPQVISGRMAQQAKGQFDTAYAILQHAVADMTSNGEDLQQGKFVNKPQTGTVTTSGTLYSKFKPYMKVSVDCGAVTSATNVCTPTYTGGMTAAVNYENYNGKTDNKLSAWLCNGSFVLQNGMLIAFSGRPNHEYAMVSIDINGKNKRPNRWGYDLFTFQIWNGELLPLGAPNTRLRNDNDSSNIKFDANPRKYCNETDIEEDRAYNGATCSYYALEDEDYFKKIYGTN